MTVSGILQQSIFFKFQESDSQLAVCNHLNDHSKINIKTNHAQPFNTKCFITQRLPQTKRVVLQEKGH